MSVVLDALNESARNWNNARYDFYKRMGWGRRVIVCEGDSWFLHPLENDIIDELSELDLFSDEPLPYRIKTLAAAGDELSQMLAEQQFVGAILDENPDAFLFSAGGNDIIGPRLAGMLRNPPGGAPPDGFIRGDMAASELSRVAAQFRLVHSLARSAKPGVQMFVHGYDYPWPGKDYWFLGLDWGLGDTLNGAGIPGEHQRAVVNRILDRFNEMLGNLAGSLENFHYIDLRNTLQENDFIDELHPDSGGVVKLARKVDAAIRRVIG